MPEPSGAKCSHESHPPARGYIVGAYSFFGLPAQDAAGETLHLDGCDLHGDHDGPCLSLQQIRRRLFYAQEDVRVRPFGHPVGVGWYAEDVPLLLARIEALEEEIVERVAEISRSRGVEQALLERLDEVERRA